MQQIVDPVALFADAARVRHRARATMEELARQASDVTLQKQGPLKKMARILEKTSFRPGAGRGKAEKICDIVRDMKLAMSMRAIAAMVRLLRESDAIEIVRVKDRFTTPSAGGWRDVMINYRLKGDSHVCEVQICHNSLVVARKGLPCLLYTSPSPRDQRGSRMPSSA